MRLSSIAALVACCACGAQAFVAPGSASRLRPGHATRATNRLHVKGGRTATSMVFSVTAEGVDALGQLSTQLLAYSDEFSAKPSVTLSAGAIGATTAAVLALFGGLAFVLARPGTGKIALTPEEQEAADAVSQLFDPTASDKELTESGSRGEVKRKQLAARAKTQYQQGRAQREVRDKTLAYGEFDLAYLTALLRIAAPAEGETFVDMGSGCGKAVFAASLLYPGLAKASGVELLTGLHQQAQGFAKKFEKVALPRSPVEFVNRDFTDEAVDLSDADVVFAYATRFATTDDGLYTTELSDKLKELKPGARVVTVDKRLMGPFSLIKTLEDPNGDLQLSTGYVWRRN